MIAQFVGTGVLLLVSAGIASANLLTNPSFENPDTPFGTGGAPEYAGATGWTDFGGPFTIEDFVGALPAHDGNQVLKVFGTAGVYQEFAVSPTDVVTGTAWAYNDSVDPMGAGQVAAVNLEWLTNGTPNGIVSFGASIDDTVAKDVWTQVGVVGATVPAGGTNGVRITLITGPFGSGGGGGAPKFDDASLTIQAIPVPAAVWLFGSGLVGLVGVARRRKG